jgi:hypothetical protein
MSPTLIGRFGDCAAAFGAIAAPATETSAKKAAMVLRAHDIVLSSWSVDMMRVFCCCVIGRDIGQQSSPGLRSDAARATERAND